MTPLVLGIIVPLAGAGRVVSGHAQVTEGGLRQPADDQGEALDDHPAREELRRRVGVHEVHHLLEGPRGHALDGGDGAVDKGVDHDATEEHEGPVAEVAADGDGEGARVEEVVQRLQVASGLAGRWSQGRRIGNP